MNNFKCRTDKACLVSFAHDAALFYAVQTRHALSLPPKKFPIIKIDNQKNINIFTKNFKHKFQ